MECVCNPKKKMRNIEEKTDLIHRLNRIEGQIRGIRTMVEEDRYCADILTQISATGAAMQAVSRALLSEHIRTCVTQGIQSGDDEVVTELLSLLQKLMK